MAAAACTRSRLTARAAPVRARRRSAAAALARPIEAVASRSTRNAEGNRLLAPETLSSGMGELADRSFCQRLFRSSSSWLSMREAFLPLANLVNVDYGQR